MADAHNKSRPNPFISALAVLGGFSVLVAALIFVLLGLAVSQMSSGISGLAKGFSHQKKEAGYLEGIGPDPIIAGIKFEGTVSSELTDEILKKLDEAKKNTFVKGIFLEVNSPGGSVVASQEIYDAIKIVKTVKPVVAYYREVAASGAYYASVASSKLVANRGTMVGSIGVILSTMDASELLGWAKLKPVALKTGALKDTGSPTRAWSERDTEYLQTLINQTRDQFVADVTDQRHLSPEAVSFMSDGRVVLGPKALELQLIDAVGSKDQALDLFMDLLGVKVVPELEYMEENEEVPSFLKNLLTSSTSQVIPQLGNAISSGVATGVQSVLDQPAKQPKLQ